MMQWLEPFNLFPYSQLWRVKREPEHHNKCTIITSIILILAIGALFIQRLVVVFNKDTMTATSQTIVSQTPPITTLSTHMKTYQDNLPGHQPFMIALDWYAGNPNYSDIQAYPPSIVAWKSTLSGSYVRSRLGHNDTIQFEPCTPEHFSMFPNIESQFLKWEAQRWICLPLNKTYTIEGSYGFDNVFSRICLMLNCSGSCMDNFHDYNFRVYTLSSLVNPTNNTEPVNFFLQEIVLPISSQVHQEYAYDMTEHYVETDHSIFPWVSSRDQSSIALDTIRFIQRNQTANESSTFIYFHRSYKTIQYKAQFLQLVDAISFVGGIFEVIIGVFAFMIIFARIFFELKFARIYFRADYQKAEKIKNFGFGKLLWQKLYKILKNMGRAPPTWQNQKLRDEYQQTVNQLLDITYLQKRIDTLERGLAIMLSEHQLKGLYLSQPKNIKKTQQSYKKHQLRDQMIHYLNLKHEKYKKQQKQEDARHHKKKYIRPSIQVDDVGLRINERRIQNRLDEVLRHEGQPEPAERVQIINSHQHLMRRDSFQDCIIPNEQQIEQYEFQLLGAADLLVNTDFEPISEMQFKTSVKPDLIKLFNEAEGQRANPVSKKIYGQIEGWFKELLRLEAKHDQIELMKRKSRHEIEGSEIEYK